MKINILIAFVFIVLLVSQACSNPPSTSQNKENKRYRNDYDIKISYCSYQNDTMDYHDHSYDKYLRDGNLYLLFEESFDNDTLELEVNNNLKFKEVLNTNHTIGAAKQFNFENIDTIWSFAIRINSGKKAYVEVDTMNLFRIIYRNNELEIIIPKRFPTYE